MAAIKEDLHKLIDTTTDKELLEDIFMILSSEGIIKKEALASERENDDETAWFSHEK